MKRVIWDRQAELGAWSTARVSGVFHADSATAIGIERDGEIVGCCMFENFLGQSVMIHCAGEGKKWMSMEFIRAVFGYCFNQLQVRKIIGPVDSMNKDSKRFIQNLGFKAEAILANAGPRGDLILYT